MRIRRYFLQGFLMIGGLCLAVNILYAQDSSKLETIHHSQQEKNRHPLETDSGVFGFPGKLHDTEKAALVNPFSAKKDTYLRKVSEANKIPIIRDTFRKNSQFNIAAGNSDSTLRRSMDTSAQKKMAVHPFTLPSFTGQSFDHYRGFVNYLLSNNAVFNHTFQNQPDEITPLIRDDNTARIKTNLFYTIVGLLFLLGILRLLFTKYFSDLFKAFFNPTLSRRQLREQLAQNPVPAFMLNIFFTLSAGLYVFLILRHFNYITVSHPLVLIPLFMLIFIIIYIVKFLFLRFSGWLFGYGEVVSGYIFTLYMINKILGVGLLPFILVLAFCTPAIAAVALNISLIFIVLMFIYRYIRMFSSERNKILFNKFHFFIYLCGFEIAPVLILGKLVLIWLNGA
ncbi:MAG: DUF4271 domain-containing protein [Chitinophagaceae bacterium]